MKSQMRAWNRYTDTVTVSCWARRAMLAGLAVLGVAVPAHAADWFVAPGGVGQP